MVLKIYWKCEMSSEGIETWGVEGAGEGRAKANCSSQNFLGLGCSARSEVGKEIEEAPLLGET